MVSGILSDSDQSPRSLVVDQVLALLEKVGWALRALLTLIIPVAISLLLVVALGVPSER